jgi:RNA polymerase sigma factor (sigma-70 family)
MNGNIPSPRASIEAAGSATLACWILAVSQNQRLTETFKVQETDSAKNATDGTSAAGTMNAMLAAVGAERDKAAFQALFEHFAPRVKGFLYRQGTSPEMAEEVVQETMVNVWRKAVQFDPARASAATWIFTIARNLRIDMLRKENRPAPDMDDPALVPDPDPAPHETISKEQEASRLRAVMAELPQEQQEVLHLAFFQEKAHPQVAEELGIPLGTVKSRIRLALRRIRSELGDNR